MTTLGSATSNLRVRGPLGVHVDRKDASLRFINVTFDEPVDFSETRALGIAFYNCTFRKGVNLSGIRLGSSLIAYRTAFEAASPSSGPALRLDNARLDDDLQLLACSVEGGVVGENTRIGGNADFRGLRVYPKHAPPQATLLQNLRVSDEFRAAFGAGYPHLNIGFRLAGSRVEGSLRLGALYDEKIKGIPDDTRFPRIAFIGGNVQLANVEILGDLQVSGLAATGGFSLQNSVVKGDIEATPRLHVEPTSRLHGSGRVVRFVAGGLFDLYGVDVGGNLHLYSAHLAAGARIIFAKVGGYLFARPVAPLREVRGGRLPPLEIGRDASQVSLDLSGSHILGVECEGARIEGYVRVSTGQFGRFVLTPLAENPGSDTMTVSPCDVGGVFMRSVAIAENARFHHIVVRDPRSDPSVTERGFMGAIQMINCSVGGDLAIGSDGLCRHISPGLPSDWQPVAERPPVSPIFGFAAGRHHATARTATHASWHKYDADHPTFVERLVDLSGTRIDRNLNLSGFAAKKEVVLDHVVVGGDVRLSKITRSYGEPIVEAAFETRCHRLSADGLRSEGDSDFSGIKVDEDVQCRRLSVRGGLLLASERPRRESRARDGDDEPADMGDDHYADACVDVGRHVDLQGASASALFVSGRSFRHDRGSLNLADTRFHSISIYDVSAFPKSRRGMLMFNNTSIERWELDDWSTAFHRKTEPHDGGAYVSIEKYLREAGRTREANRVLRDRFRRRMRGLFPTDLSHPKTVFGRRPPEFLRLLCAVLWMAVAWPCVAIAALIGEAIGYGTQPVWSFVVIIAALFWSTWLFSDPRNVDVSSALRGRLAHVSALPEVHPRDQRWPEYCSGDQRCIDVGTHWNGASAFVLALRHNVPLVGTAVEDVWKPAVSVSERARVLALVSWICWPVFAGTLSQYILRRKPG